MQTGILTYKILLVAVFIAISVHHTMGQTKLHVITKTVEKSFTASSSTNLRIEGQKASVKVDTWNKNEVKVVLKLISKSPEKEKAEKELAYQRYILEKRRETIYLKNYLTLPNTVSKLGSIQVASYEVTVPRGCKMEVFNQYGDVNISDLFGVINLEVKYGKIRLENLNAAIQVQSYFGDLIMRNIDGQMDVTANHTKINLEDIAGDVRLKSTLGDVFIGNIEDVKTLEITASKADITLENPDYQQFNFSMVSKFGDVLVPPKYEKYFKPKEGDNKSFVYKPVAKGNLISLRTSFGNIVAK